MITPIKIELASIKHNARLSEETYCYSAKLMVDGRHIADVGNDGHGGADRYLGPGKGIAYGDGSRLYDEACRRVIAEHPKRNLADPGEPANLVDDSLEFMCARLVTDHLLLKDLKREIKRKVLAFPDGMPADGATANLLGWRKDPPGDAVPPALKAAILKRHPSAAILNDMADTDMLAAYRRAA